MDGPGEHVAAFPARMSALSDVLAFTSKVCEAARLDEDTCLKVILLVEELFTNTVAHGYGHDSDEPVRVAFAVEPGRMTMTYEDAGPPHDPFAGVVPPDDRTSVQDRPVGGLGVVLVAAIATDVEYRRAEGKNRIRLAIAAPADPAALAVLEFDRIRDFPTTASQRRLPMDANAKKTALRMIPYGLFVLTAESKSGVAAATVNWVTQASFAPPLVAVGVKADSHAHTVIKESNAFALNVLGKGQQAMAFTFFKPAERQGSTISGEPTRAGSTGSPILTNTPAFVECRLVATVEKGDHSVFVGEVVEAGVAKEPDGRADDATLWLKELGDKVFYGG